METPVQRPNCRDSQSLAKFDQRGALMWSGPRVAVDTYNVIRYILPINWQDQGEVCALVAIISFADKGTEGLFEGNDSKAARKACPEQSKKTAIRKLDQMNAVGRLADLAIPPGNHLEALKGDRIGQHSIRINDQFRICFRWTEAGCEEVEIVDYHS